MTCEVRIEVSGDVIAVVAGERRRQLASNQVIVLGRTPEVPDDQRRALLPPAMTVVERWALAATQISGWHAAIWADDAWVHVVDLRSRNGTEMLAPLQAVLRADRYAALRSTLAEQPLIFRIPGPPGGALADGPSLEGLTEEDAAAATVRWIETLGLNVTAEVVSPAAPVPPHCFQQVLGDERAVRVTWSGTASIELMNRLVELRGSMSGLPERLLTGELIHRSPASQRARDAVIAAARGGRRLLLLGPTGSGKSELARLYDRTWRAGRPDAPALTALNCAAIDDSRIDERLWGSRARAFQRGTDDIRGAVELARGGVLFLDEIGELSPRAQGALLTFLDFRHIAAADAAHAAPHGRQTAAGFVERRIRAGAYTRLGENEPCFSDAQLVSATNEDLDARCADGRFRHDLRFRLDDATVVVPALAACPEDMVAFVDQSLGTTRFADRPRVLELLRRWPWPGGWRELRRFCEQVIDATSGKGPLATARCTELLEVAHRNAPPVLAPDTDRFAHLKDIAAATWKHAEARSEWAHFGDLAKAAALATVAARALGRGIDELPRWDDLQRSARTELRTLELMVPCDRRTLAAAYQLFDTYLRR